MHGETIKVIYQLVQNILQRTYTTTNIATL